VVEINPLGHRTERTYHDLLGLPATTSDPNGLVIRNEYDGFGDLRKTISPTGLITSRSTSFETGISVFRRSVSHSTTSQVGQLPPTKTYYDNAGRPLRVETAGFDERDIIQVNEYDPRGRLVRRSLPYFLDELEAFEEDSAKNINPLHFVVTSFDDLNRETSVTSPDGGTSRVVYDGTTTVMVDELGRATTKIVNLKGLVVKTIDSAGGVLQFEYGAGDRHVRTLHTDGNELVTKYDVVGNKTSTHDPDLGRWVYRYNSFGEVIWQRDAKGQTTSVEYDALGRPTRRVMPELIEQFQYDNSNMGIGKLSSVQSSNGYSEKYSYERFGRLEGKEVQIDRDLFITRYVYDEYDRIVGTFHPENFRTKNVYSSSGHLSSVFANDPTGSFLDPLQLQWEAIERDQFGRVTLEKFGNGVESLTEHNDEKGSVDRIQLSLAGDSLYDLSLEYDLVGNLKSRAESTIGRSETFEYDELYRISRWALNGKIQADYAYDQAGRILLKSDIGNYSYAGGGPTHGVKEITSVEGETWKYTYDANGNMISGPKGHFEYYSNNSVRSIYKSDNLWSKFWYAPDGSRYRQLFSQKKQIGDMLGEHSLVETVSVGAYERIRDVGGVQGVRTGGALRAASVNPFGIAPHGFSRHRLHIATDSGVVAILEANTQYDPLHGYHEHKQAHRNAAISIAKSGFNRSYVHTDELGSIVRVTDQDGKVADAYVYDPWGKKERISLKGMPRSRYAEGSFRRGFTGHEHLENLELVHMNGRVYDPDIARFVSADVFIQAPLVSSFYDRYSYVANNPLKFVDPTGHFLKSIGKFFKKVGDAIARPFREAGRWLKKNWREVVVTVVAVAIVVFSGGTATPLAAVMVGAAAGAASAGLYVALYGGDLSDVLFAAARGAIIGGFSAGVAHGIGSMQLGAYKSALAHGSTQGVVAEANGGRFVQGFLSGSFSSLAGSQMAKSTALRNSVSAQAAASAVVGGTASTIGGGKFANGAISGLFVVAFNHLAHRGDVNSGGSREPASGTNSMGEEVAELEFDLSVGQSAGSSKYGGIYNFSTETGNHEFSAGYGIAGFTLSSSGEMDIMFGPQLKYGGFTSGEFTLGTTVNDPYWIDFKVKARVLGIGGSVRLHETQGFYNEFKNFGPRLMNYLTNGQMRYGY
jgi:RHS repeat-associated protein